MMKLQFTRSAQRDLERLREFIAKKNPSAARRISQRLKKAITRLLEHPKMGVMVEEIEEARDLIQGDYIVRYTLLENTVIFLRIWHGKEER
jgi:toxin ParE1/3/4